MDYTTFFETVNQTLEKMLQDGQQLVIRPVPKNNGILLDGLSIQIPGSNLAPTVYLNPYYEQYQNGMAIQEICDDILKLFRDNPPPLCASEKSLGDFESMRPRIMMKLIHAGSNQLLLSDIPHVPYLDLAIVFYLFLDRNPAGQMTALIHNDFLERWQASAQDLLSLALQNTPKAYPAVIRSMSDVMKDIARQHMGSDYREDCLDLLLEEEDTSPLYVLTNQPGIYGACCILYKDTLKNFADSVKNDLIILPSSIHEVLLTPDEKGISYDYLNSMVVQINHSEVPVEDQLSNHIYLYTRKDDEIHDLWSSGFSSDGSPYPA